MMGVLNWLLIHVGDAAQWLWAALEPFFGAVWTNLDWLLNPVLSPLLALLNHVCTPIGDTVYAVLSPLPPWAGLVIISGVVGVVLLLAFRFTSNQAALGRARDDIAANLLALKLFKDDLRVGLRSQRRVFGALLRLQWHMLRPVLIMLLPILLVLGQMGLRYQWRPLRPGERSLIRLHLTDAPAGYLFMKATLEPSPGLVVEAGPVPGGGQLVWRVRGGEAGRHMLRFRLDGEVLEKDLVVGDGLQRVSAARVGPRWTAQILHPAEPRLPNGGPVRTIEIEYAGVESHFYGRNWWVLWFFVVSMAAALALKPVFKVRF